MDTINKKRFSCLERKPSASGHSRWSIVVFFFPLQHHQCGSPWTHVCKKRRRASDHRMIRPWIHTLIDGDDFQRPLVGRSLGNGFVFRMLGVMSAGSRINWLICLCASSPFPAVQLTLSSFLEVGVYLF